MNPPFPHLSIQTSNPWLFPFFSKPTSSTLGLRTSYLMHGLLQLSLNSLACLNFLCHAPPATLLMGLITPWQNRQKSFLPSKRYRLLVFTSVASELSLRIPLCLPSVRIRFTKLIFLLRPTALSFMLFFSPGNPTLNPSTQ